ncbi:atp-binding cassette sub-family b [Holotrichia oblita]|nr:atp-binding cassette sub-family b [Holotrichia oblita]
MIEAIIELIIPIIIARLIDKSIPSGVFNSIILDAGIMFGLTTLGLFCALICQYHASRASQGFGTNLRKELMRKITALNYNDLDKIESGSLINRITGDVNALQLGLAQSLRLLTRAPVLIIGAAVGAFLINPKISLIFIIASPLIIFSMGFLMLRVMPVIKKGNRSLDEVSTVTKENLTGVKVVRAFAKSGYEKERFTQINRKHFNLNVKANVLLGLINPINFILINLSVALIVWFGAEQVNTGGMTKGEIVAIISYMTQIQLSLIVLAMMSITFTKAAVSSVRVKEILDISAPPLSSKELPAFIPEKINFNNVSFSYAQNASILQDISFEVKKGQRLGIIGSTGSGKSTLSNLFPRLYDCDSGSITMDGVDIRDFEVQSYRKLFGFVPQAAALFRGSVRHNMLLSNPSASDLDIWKALQIAQADTFVKELPGQLDFNVEQGGRNFSGGQKQLLTIARALVSNPPIIVLDDSSSALDLNTDSRLRAALRESLDPSSILIIISQRIHSIADCDKILVLDNGHKVGEGTHSELKKTNEVYKEICHSQDYED